MMDLGNGTLLGSIGQTFDPESGSFLSEKAQRIAELINEYDPNLFLMWIPPRDRAGNAPPYAIAHHKEDGSWYPVMVFGEDRLDHRIIGDLWAMERNTRDLNGYLDAQDAAARAEQLKKQKDLQDEMHDMAGTIFKSPLHTFRLSKDKVIRS